MRVHHHELHVDSTVLGAASLLALALGGSSANPVDSPGHKTVKTTVPAPVGHWLSEDGTVRLDINTDGTYAGKVAGRRRPAHGTYDLEGATMTLRDDSGLRTPVTLHGDGRLEMAGHRLGLA